YSRHTRDWLGTEKYILPGLTRPSSNTQPLKSEIVQGASFTLNENSTAFSTKDTQGSILTLAAPPILTKTTHWNAEALAIARAFGPPPGSPTFGSHSWIGACWVLNPNSNVQWLMATQTSPGVFEEIDIDTAVPTHRRPMIMVSSARARIEQTERRRFGRTEMTQLTSIPGSVTHTATTNLRHRHSMQLYDAGYPQWHDLLEGKNCARVVLNTSWDGGDPGTAYQNGTIGEGSRSCAIAQYHSGAYVEGNICDNQIGAGHWVGSSHDLYVRRHNVFSSTWSMYPLGTPPLFKEGTHYNTADSGRAGAGGESYSRNGFNNRNLYLGNKSHCYIVLSRSTEQVTDWDVRKMPDSPAMIQYSQRGNSLDDDDRPRFRAEGEYSQGNGGGSVISKNRPQQHHGWRTHIKFHVSVDDGGIAELFEYTGNYDLEKHIILCPPDHNPFAGYAALTLLSSTYGFRSVDFFIANPVRGVYDQRQKPGFPPVALTPAETQNWFIDFAFLNAGTEFINVPTEGADNRVISLSGNYDGPFGCDITEVQEAPNAGPGNQVRYVGTARTPFGDTIYPFPTPSDESGGLPVPGTRMGGAVSQYGYWTNSDPGASPPYFSLYELAITNDLPPNQELTVLYPLPIRIPPANLAAVWTHTTGAKKTITHHGSASYTDAVAAARTAFQNGAF
ncbi:MAG: hypothetical protein KAH44_07995, partial [Oricola sp.]|nr:hypothetical protein [Oricola sp.]